jgi:RNA polymerase sigma-32 factor
MSIDGNRADYPVHAPAGSFPDQQQLASARKPDGRYLDSIRRFSMLERDQEYLLAKRWRDHGDRDAANQLVTSHLRLAVRIAMNYRGYGLPVSEIISEGNVGLLQALDRFEPDRGFRFSTYAMWWIRASIQDYILRSWSLVKIGTTASQKKLFFKLRSAKNKIASLQSGDMHPDQVSLIAKSLAVADQDVVDMNRRLGGDSSLNTPIRDDGEAGEWQDYLVDPTPSPETLMAVQEETDHQREALVHAIALLNQRERRIFEARHLAEEPMTLEELATEFNLSRERVRQLEVRAFDKVRRAAKNRVAETQMPAALRASCQRLNAPAADCAGKKSRPGASGHATQPRRNGLSRRSGNPRMTALDRDGGADHGDRRLAGIPKKSCAMVPRRQLRAPGLAG